MLDFGPWVAVIGLALTAIGVGLSVVALVRSGRQQGSLAALIAWPEPAALMARRSGEVVRSDRMKGHPAAIQPWSKACYTSTGSLDFVYT